MLSGIDIAGMLQKQGYTIKSSTKTSLTVLVKGSRYTGIETLVKGLSHLGAKYDPNAKGSSIGAIIVDGRIKILIKADGKTGGLDVEARAIEMLNSAILGAMSIVGGPITIKMKHRSVSNIVGVEKTSGTPKSDFHCVDKNGKSVIFISHKKGSKPNDFQQWGGLTEKQIESHSYVKQFEQICKMLYGDVIPSGESLCGILPKNQEANDLKLMAVYGVDAPYKTPGINCVDVLIQGDPSLKQISSNVFTFESTGHIHYIPDIPGDGFDPVLAMIYKGDRSNLGIKGGRASVYPHKGRNFKTTVYLK